MKRPIFFFRPTRIRAVRVTRDYSLPLGPQIAGCLFVRTNAFLKVRDFVERSGAQLVLWNLVDHNRIRNLYWGRRRNRWRLFNGRTFRLTPIIVKRTAERGAEFNGRLKPSVRILGQQLVYDGRD